MSDAEVAQILSYDLAGLDATWYMTSGTQLRASYDKACFGVGARAKVPHMKIWVLIGDVTLPFGIAATWQVEADNNSKGGGKSVSVKWVPSTNHFVSHILDLWTWSS